MCFRRFLTFRLLVRMSIPSSQGVARAAASLFLTENFHHTPAITGDTYVLVVAQGWDHHSGFLAASRIAVSSVTSTGIPLIVMWMISDIILIFRLLFHLLFLSRFRGIQGFRSSSRSSLVVPDGTTSSEFYCFYFPLRLRSGGPVLISTLASIFSNFHISINHLLPEIFHDGGKGVGLLIDPGRIWRCIASFRSV